MPRVLAVDLGATSVRVAAVDFDKKPPSIEIVHRHRHGPVRADDGTLRWDWDRLMREVQRGLEVGLRRGPVASIGVDTWGVDYGLLDANGRLLSAPFSYRDARTSKWMDVVQRVGVEALYSITGIQLMPINTLFQLAAHNRTELNSAARLLMLPELIVHDFTSTTTGERTSAGTTALVDVRSGSWSERLLDALDLPSSLFPSIASAGERAGTWCGVPVHLVGGHDTASAALALPSPLTPKAAFVSSGTWLLVGVERPEPDTSEKARIANFSNEPGALGGVRFLKNVMGFWLLDRCRERWGGPSIDTLMAEAASLPLGPVVNANDPRFLAPADMEAEIRSASGLGETAGRAQVVRCIMDSLVAATADVIDDLSSFVGPVSELHVISGGARNGFFTRLLEEACGIPVRAGAVEATALGNAMVQGIALGCFESLSDARAALTVETS